MTRDDIIRMARGAARSEHSRLLGCGIDDLERFFQAAYAAGAAAENEACAKRLEAVGCDHCAANIRARRQA